jgi:hypothetical protein
VHGFESEDSSSACALAIGLSGGPVTAIDNPRFVGAQTGISINDYNYAQVPALVNLFYPATAPPPPLITGFVSTASHSLSHGAQLDLVFEATVPVGTSVDELLSGITPTVIDTATISGSTLADVNYSTVSDASFETNANVPALSRIGLTLLLLSFLITGWFLAGRQFH